MAMKNDSYNFKYIFFHLMAKLKFSVISFLRNHSNIDRSKEQCLIDRLCFYNFVKSIYLLLLIQLCKNVNILYYTVTIYVHIHTHMHIYIMSTCFYIKITFTVI